jgi:hypothetical protein
MKDKVVIVKERSKNDEEIKKVEKYLPIFEKHAGFLGKQIVIDVPHGEAIEPTNDGKLHIHIYSSPIALDFQEKSLLKVFGFNLEKEKSLLKMLWVYYPPVNRIQENLVPGSLDREEENIFSPEGDLIVKILPKNIYILFDFFDFEWEGREIVLDQILEEAIPRALMNGEKDFLSARKTIRAYQKNLIRFYRRRLLKNNDEAREEYAQFCLLKFKKMLSEAETAIDKKRAEHEGLSQELAETYLKVDVLRGQIEDLEHAEKYSLEKYAKEFDLILRTEHIRGLKIQKTDSGAQIVAVYTDRIFWENQWHNKKDIGDFEILIFIYPGRIISQHVDFLHSNQAPTWIEINQGSFGQYEHKEVKSSGYPCFGNDENMGGLNIEVNKLYIDGDFLSIIQWTLALLQMDSRGVEMRQGKVPSCEIPSYELPFSPAQEPSSKHVCPSNEESIATQKESASACELSSGPFYSSDEEKNQNRQAYAELVQNLKEKKLKQLLEKILAETKKTSGEKRIEFAEIRSSLKNAIWMRNNLEKKISRRYFEAREEFLDLLKNKEIAEVKVFPGLLQILMKKESEDGSFHLLRIWFHPLSDIIWTRSFSDALVKNISLGGEEEKEFHEFIFRQMTEGKLAKAAILLRDFIF